MKLAKVILEVLWPAEIALYLIEDDAEDNGVRYHFTSKPKG